MKIFFTLFILTFYSFVIYSQDNTTTTTSNEEESSKGSWDISTDLATRYVWRGQAWGGNFPVVQIYGKYYVTNKLSLGFWATHNFRHQSLYSNDIGEYKGYQEIDFIANYDFTDFFKASLQWYYWPSTSPVDGVSNEFFNFGNDGVNTLDLMLMFDFSSKNFPLLFTWSTFLSGNDFRYADEDDADGTRNYTSYAELGYNIDLPTNITLTPVVGAVFNNKAGYYSYGDRDKISFVNIGAKLSKEFEISEKLTMPVWVQYTHNAANSEYSIPQGNYDLMKDYIIIGFTLTYAK